MLGHAASSQFLKKLSRQILLESLFYRFHMRLFMIVLALVATVLGLLVPFFQRSFINHLSEEHAWQSGWWMLGVLVAGVGQQGLQALFRIVGNREGLLIQKALSQALYEKTIHLAPEVRSRHTVGETVNYYAQDIPTVGTFVEEFFPASLISILSLVSAPLVVALFLNIPISGVLAVTGTSLGLSIWLGNRQARFFVLNKQNAQMRMGVVNEWLQNMRIVRILGWTERFEQKIEAARVVETRTRLAMVTNGSSMNSIAQVTPFVINVAGVFALVQQRGMGTTPGDVFAVLWVFGVFFMRPLRIFPFLIANWHDARTSATRLESFFCLPQEDSGGENVAELSTAASLRVQNLNLEMGGKRLLKNISLDVAAGSFVVVVGEVGCGKTLLLQALMRAVPATFDNYAVDNVSVSAMSLASLRQHFGYVSQEGFVMSASLRDNVALQYGTLNTQDDEILRRLVTAQFHPTNEHMTHGLATEIGERGVNLSGGQRQRVNLARCGYFERPILLLDDCLSAVDVETEKSLVENLFLGTWKQKTRILVTHRLSVLPYADAVLFMENGEIVEVGQFNDLQKSSARVQAYIAAHERKRDAQGGAE